MPFIFISYSHKDSEYANRLADSLEAKGLDVWIDERIDYGARWPQAIQENLDKCAAFVVVMTPDSFDSEWVQAELTRARRLRKPIFPLLLEGDVWLALEATLYVDVHGAKLPPPRFYTGLAGALSTGQGPAAPSTHVRERLQTELGELQRRYDNLTSRIAAVDTDLGRALDSEHKLTLEERRAELAGKRDETSARMAQIERTLAEQPASERAVQASEPKSAAPPADVAKGEVKAKPAVQVEPVLLKPATPAEPARPDLLVLDKPFRLELVRVPAGEFLTGSDPSKDKDAFTWEKPHRLTLPEYYIGKYPVTNEQYAVFVMQTQGKAPDHWHGGKIPTGKERHPVVTVSWQDAKAFCEWASQATGAVFRLPSEAEWEKAARGVDGRVYPWGNQPPTSELCNFGGSKIGDTTSVERYPQGASPYGALDMAGNVWEWTSNLFRPYPYNAADGRADLQTTVDINPVVRGGSYNNDGRNVRCAARDKHYPKVHLHFLGFRVVCVSPLS